MAAWIEEGPELERDGVVRWRCVDLQLRLAREFAVQLYQPTESLTLAGIPESAASRFCVAWSNSHKVMWMGKPVEIAPAEKSCPEPVAVSWRSIAGSWLSPRLWNGPDILMTIGSLS